MFRWRIVSGSTMMSWQCSKRPARTFCTARAATPSWDQASPACQRCWRVASRRPLAPTARPATTPGYVHRDAPGIAGAKLPVGTRGAAAHKIVHMAPRAAPERWLGRPARLPRGWQESRFDHRRPRRFVRRPDGGFRQDDPFKRLVSCYQSACVQTSLVDGQIVMENRQLLSMDEQQVLEDARRLGRRSRKSKPMDTIKRQPSLSSQVLDLLMEKIRSGAYPPGSLLPPENELAAEYKVSRATIRSAFDRLEARGLIVRRQGSALLCAIFPASPTRSTSSWIFLT